MTKVVSVTCLLLIIVICSEIHSKRVRKVRNKLPAYFPTCYRNDPALNKCLLEATKQVQPYLVTGVPELGFPAFEPFNLPEIYMEQGTNNLNYKVTLKNIVVHGLTNYEFENMDFDIPNLKMVSDFVMPGLNAEGTYSITGQVIVTPIEGNGKFTASSGPSRGHLVQQYKEITLADGKIHLAPVSTNGSLDITNPDGKFDGLFNGNERLNSIITQVFNENREELNKELKPVLEKTLFKITEDLFFSTILKRVAFEDLFPISDLYPK